MVTLFLGPWQLLWPSNSMWNDEIWVEVGKAVSRLNLHSGTVLTLTSPSHRQAWAEGRPPSTTTHRNVKWHTLHSKKALELAWSHGAELPQHRGTPFWRLSHQGETNVCLPQATLCVDLCESSLVCMPQGDCPRIQDLVPFVPNSKYPLVKLLEVFIVLNLFQVMLSFLLLL